MPKTIKWAEITHELLGLWNIHYHETIKEIVYSVNVGRGRSIYASGLIKGINNFLVKHKIDECEITCGYGSETSDDCDLYYYCSFVKAKTQEQLEAELNDAIKRAKNGKEYQDYLKAKRKFAILDTESEDTND